MNEVNFEQIISDICGLCKDLEKKRENRRDVEGIELYKQRASERQELEKYLTSLTSDTLNTICAMMDFGRTYLNKTLPVNLDQVFNKYYLTYWFDKNKNEEKSITASYLIGMYSVLPKYLNRAKDILYYLKERNIPLLDDCGGYLCLEESDGIVEVDYDTYELHLKCLECKSCMTKIVDKKYLSQKSI